MITQEQYSTAHRALLYTASYYDLTPTAVRVLVGIAELSGVGPVRTDDLERRLHLNPSSIRRCLSEELRPTYLEGGDKRGVRIPLLLNRDGLDVVRAYASALVTFSS